MKERDIKTSSETDTKQRMAVEEAVKQAAWQHLKSEDAASALSWYEPDAIVASHGSLYPSFDRFAEDTRAFYGNLRHVHLAVWDDMYVQVLSADANQVCHRKKRYTGRDIVMHCGEFVQDIS
jgi:hypothetical protein